MNYRAFKILNKQCPQMFMSIFISSLVSGITPYIEIFFTARILNALSSGTQPSQIWNMLIIMLAVTSVLSLLNALLTRWKNKKKAFFSSKLDKLYSDKMLNMDYQKLSEQHTHELRTNIFQNENWSGWGMTEIVRFFENIVNATIQIVGAIILTCSLFMYDIPVINPQLQFLDHPLFILGIISIMVIAILVGPICRNKSNSYWAKNDNESKEGNLYFGFFGFMAYDKSRALDIRMYNQDKFCDYYSKKNRSFLPGSQIAQAAKGPMGIWNALAEAIFIVFYGITYMYIGLKAWAGAFAVGSAMQYITSIISLSKGISLIIETLGAMKTNASFLKDNFEFLDIANATHNVVKTLDNENDINEEIGEIEFRNVSFQYEGSDQNALKNISVNINSGHRIAIVGENGSGKTTFIKLLSRLYEPTQGEILLNGKNIKDYPYDDYIKIISAVFQDFKLLAFSIAQNVAGSATFDEKKVNKCLNMAGFSERLQTLEKGINTYLYKEFDKKGIEVSGGEAQKIAIARALYKDAPIVILDEPTAALDPRAEADIYSRFNEMVEKKTSIYISHRLSSCRFCDEIIVFDNGEIVQKGTHENLLEKQEEKYYQLWQAQAQYYEGSVSYH